MAKKTFIALADAIKDHNQKMFLPKDQFGFTQLNTLARFCECQNSNFNRERWFSYIKGGVRAEWWENLTLKTVNEKSICI